MMLVLGVVKYGALVCFVMKQFWTMFNTSSNQQLTAVLLLLYYLIVARSAGPEGVCQGVSFVACFSATKVLLATSCQQC